MSNSVRSLGSGRGVDAAARAAASHQVDSDGPDDAFAMAMNLAIGATGNAGAANGGGTDADGGIDGQSGRGNGGGNAPPTLLAQSGDVSDVNAGTVAKVRGHAHFSRGDVVAALASGDSESPSVVGDAPADISSDPGAGADGPTNAGRAWRQSDDISTTSPQTSVTSGASLAINAAPTDIATSPLPTVAASDGDGSDPADIVSATPPRRHRSDAPGSSTNTPRAANDGRAAPSPGATAILLSNVAIAPGGSARAPAQAGGASRAASSFDRFGWRPRVEDAALRAARFADQADPSPTAPPSISSPNPPRGVIPPSTQIDVSANAGQIFAPLSAGAQADDGSASTAPPSPVSAPPITMDQRDDATVAPVLNGNSTFVFPTPPVFPGPGANDPGVTGQTSIAAVDGMAGAAPPSAPGAAPTLSAGDAAATTGSAPSFGDAIANHVLSMVSSGHQEATLQLQPPQLGELTVRVAVQGRDVSTWFGAAQPQVQLAVSQAMDQLRTDLAGAGLNLAGAWVGADASSMQQRSFDDGPAPSRRQGFVAPTVEQASVAGTDPSRASSGVNFYV